MLSVDGAEDAFALGDFQNAEGRVRRRRLELQRFIARDDHGAGNRRQIARLLALLVVGDELVDLLANDLALVGFFARRDAALKQIPMHLRLILRAAHTGGRPVVPIVQDLEAHELVDVPGGQGSLIELHAKLLHPKRGDADHKDAGPLRALVERKPAIRRNARLYVSRPLDHKRPPTTGGRRFGGQAARATFL